MEHRIIIKRAYEDISSIPGKKYLVDIWWPRGIKKEKLKDAEWKKTISPSSEVIKRFHAGEIAFEEFKREYLNKLDKNQDAKDFLEQCKADLANEDVILLYAAKNEQENNAIVLKEWLEKFLT